MKRRISKITAMIMLITLCLQSFAFAEKDAKLILEGAEYLLLPSAGMESRVQYTAVRSGADDFGEDYIYETDSDKVSVDAEGVVTLTEAAEDFTLTVRLAENPTVSASKKVTVAPGYYDDFESYRVGDVPKNWVNSVTVKSDGTNQSASLAAWNSRFMKTDGALTDQLSGIYTVAYRCKVNGLGSSGVVLAIGPTASWGSYVEAKVKASGGGYSLVVVQDGADQALTALPIGKWFDLACSFDLDRSVYKIYIDGALVGSELSFQGDKVNGLDRMLLDRDKEIDDLQFFSGEAVMSEKADDASITVSGPSAVLKPSSDAVSAVQYHASCSENGKSVPKEIVWSSSAGEMDENGNLYLDRSITADQITVTAAAADRPEVYQSYTVTVKDGFFDDFNDPTLPRSLGTLSFVETDGQSAVVANSLQTQFREGSSGFATLDFDIYLNASSGMILDLGQSMNWGTYLKLALSSADGELCISDNLGADLGRIAAGKWCRIKIELDFDAGTYTLYIDGVLHGADLPLADSASVRNIGKLWFSRSSVDNVAVYDGAENGLPAIYGKSVIAIPEEGQETAESYTVKNRAKTKEAEFSMDAAGGVSITSDGTLQVSASAAEGEYQILADADGRQYQKTIALIRQTAVYRLSGDDVIRILPGETEKQVSYTVTDQSAATASADYAIYPQNKGVSVDENGTLTVLPDSEDGTYLMVASVNGQRLKKQIKIMRDRFVIDGADTVSAAPSVVTMAEYRVDGRDVTYEISPIGQGVSISTEGILRVLPTAKSGTYTVRASWKQDTAFYGTKAVTVDRKNRPSGIYADDSGFLLYGTPNTAYAITISCAESYQAKDFAPLSVITAETDANGRASITDIGTKNGLYRAVLGEDTAFFAVGAQTLLTGDLQSDAFYAALSNCCGFSYAEITALKVKSRELTNQAKAAALCGGKIEQYPTAISLWHYIESKKRISETEENALCEEIRSLGFDPAPITLANAAYRPDLVLQSAAAENPDSIETALEQIKTAAILKGIAYAANDKDIKKYLAVCGSTRYSSADETQKNRIAALIAGNEYQTTAQLIRAIDALQLDSGNGGGSAGGSLGGGGGSLGGGGVSTGKVEVQPTEQPAPSESLRFADVKKQDWYYHYVETMAKKGIIVGEDGRFYPDRAVSRAEFVKMLCEIFSVPSDHDGGFTDVAADAWYAPYIGGAAKQNLVEGSDGRFDPNAPIRREDAAVLMLRFASYAGMTWEDTKEDYIDSESIAPYAKDAVAYLSGAGVISGFEDQSFRPEMTATRAEAAAMLARIADRQGGAA